MVGLAGAPGSGKTTIATHLVQRLRISLTLCASPWSGCRLNAESKSDDIPLSIVVPMDGYRITAAALSCITFRSVQVFIAIGMNSSRWPIQSTPENVGARTGHSTPTPSLPPLKNCDATEKTSFFFPPSTTASAIPSRTASAFPERHNLLSSKATTSSWVSHTSHLLSATIPFAIVRYCTLESNGGSDGRDLVCRL